MDVPPTLRTWFVVHAALALGAGVPLLCAPEWALSGLGWPNVDPVTSRLLGAALIAVGTQAYRLRAAGVEVYRALVGFNVVWSLGAVLALFAAIGRGAPPAT